MTARIALPEFGTDYVVDRLMGSGPLGTALLERVKATQAQTSALVPQGTTHDLTKVTQGGLELGVPKNSEHPIQKVTDEALSLIERNLKSDAVNICVFEDQLAAPGDPWLSRSRLRHTVLARTVYYPVLAGDSREVLATTLRSARRLDLFLCALAKIRENCIVSWLGSSVCEQDIVTLASGTTSIITSAYDGEGFVIWEASRSSEA
jgi:hypothetical protein